MRELRRIDHINSLGDLRDNLVIYGTNYFVRFSIYVSDMFLEIVPIHKNNTKAAFK